MDLKLCRELPVPLCLESKIMLLIRWMADEILRTHRCFAVTRRNAAFPFPSSVCLRISKIENLL
jgi:hypothetical protein